MDAKAAGGEVTTSIEMEALIYTIIMCCLLPFLKSLLDKISRNKYLRKTICIPVKVCHHRATRSYKNLWYCSLPLPKIGHQPHTSMKIPFMYSFSGKCAAQSQFPPHSCVCERFVFSQDQSTFFSAAE